MVFGDQENSSGIFSQEVHFGVCRHTRHAFRPPVTDVIESLGSPKMKTLKQKYKKFGIVREHLSQNYSRDEIQQIILPIFKKILMAARSKRRSQNILSQVGCASLNHQVNLMFTSSVNFTCLKVDSFEEAES